MATDSKTQAVRRPEQLKQRIMCKHPGCKLIFYKCVEKNGLKHNKGVCPLRLLTNSFRGRFFKELWDLKKKYTNLCADLMIKMAKHQQINYKNKQGSILLFPKNHNGTAIQKSFIVIQQLSTEINKILSEIYKKDMIFHHFYRNVYTNPYQSPESIKKLHILKYKKAPALPLDKCEAIVIKGFPTRQSNKAKYATRVLERRSYIRQPPQMNISCFPLNGIYKKEDVVNGYPQFRFLGKWGKYDDIVLHRYCPTPDSEPKWMISCRKSIKKGRAWVMMSKPSYEMVFDGIKESQKYGGSTNNLKEWSLLEISDNPACENAIWSRFCKPRSSKSEKWICDPKIKSVGYATLKEAMDSLKKCPNCDKPYHKKPTTECKYSCVILPCSIPSSVKGADTHWVWDGGSHDGQVVSDKLVKTLIAIDSKTAISAVCRGWTAVLKKKDPVITSTINAYHHGHHHGHHHHPSMAHDCIQDIIYTNKCPMFRAQVPFGNITMSIDDRQRPVSVPVAVDPSLTATSAVTPTPSTPTPAAPPTPPPTPTHDATPAPAATLTRSLVTHSTTCSQAQPSLLPKKYDPSHFCQSWETCCEENLKLQPSGTISKRVTRSMTSGRRE